MRIVSLEPFLTEIIGYCGLAEQLVGVTHLCDYPEPVLNLPKVTDDKPKGREQIQVLSKYHVNREAIVELNPDLVLTSLTDDAPEDFPLRLQVALGEKLKKPVTVRSFKITTLQSMYDTFEAVGKDLGKADKGRNLAHRIKAQLMDWGDNFYPRMKNKKVTILSGVSPLTLAGRWLPDLVKLASCQAQHFVAGDPDKITSWLEIGNFKPDVILVSPEGYNLQQSMKLFHEFEKVPEWESIPAVKRGEVIFADGITLYRPGPRLLDGAALLTSAMAGLDSGYITTRDSFYRLRYLEMNRHKI